MEIKVDWFSKLLSFLKLPMRLIGFIAFFSGLLLFLPSSLIETLKLNEFIGLYGKFFGIAFLLSITYFLFLFLPATYSFFRERYKRKSVEKEFLRNIDQTLQELTYPERCLLREFVLQNRHVIECPIEDPEVTSLMNKGILRVASKNVRSFVFGNYIFVEINSKARERFTIDTYGLSSMDPSKLDRAKITRERPDFTTQIERINRLMSGKYLF